MFERAVAGKTEIVKFSLEDGLQEVLSPDATRFLGVRNDREVLFVEPKGDLESALWSHDLTTSKKSLVLSSGAVLPAGSEDASSTSFVVLARSTPSAEPFDHVLYRLQDTGTALRFRAAPAGSGFDQAFPFRDGVLFSTVALGGEMYGRVSLQSRDGKVQTLSKLARIVDHTDEGGVLLLERTSSDETSATESPSEGIQLLVYLGPGEKTPRRLLKAPSSYQNARLCGDAALASSYSEGEHRLDLIDLTNGTVKNLFHSPTVQVSEIQRVDDHAAVCVFETIAADGMVQESVLSFVPLDGSERIDLDRTDSGFIHLAPADYCES